ncbi:hypothetical protein [Halorhabdus rudnickae]|uniref:hypothetical protein n=1 Tax=Halorhabdus rudnickae TaxID=1775544 RepID=UPI0010826651|nr:hypothetical protein [Halorhabdus rudnickae]
MTDRSFALHWLLEYTGRYLREQRTFVIAFTVLGLVQGLLFGVITFVEIPLITAAFPRQGAIYPMLSLVPNGPLVAHPLPGTFVGLHPTLIAVYIVSAILKIVAITLALAAAIWRSTPETDGWLPPVRRLLWLGVFVAVVTTVLIPGVVGYAPVSGWFEPIAVVLLLAYLVTRLFVVPVTIVRDGRSLPSAIRWSWAVCRSVIVTIAILGFAILQYWFSGLPWIGVAPEPTRLILATVFDTAVFGAPYTALMCATYDQVPADLRE